MVSWPEEVADALLDVAGAGAACAVHPGHVYCYWLQNLKGSPRYTKAIHS